MCPSVMYLTKMVRTTPSCGWARPANQQLEERLDEPTKLLVEVRVARFQVAELVVPTKKYRFPQREEFSLDATCDSLRSA